MKSSWPSSPAGRRKEEGLEAEAGRHQPEQLAADSRLSGSSGPGSSTWQAFLPQEPVSPSLQPWKSEMVWSLELETLGELCRDP